MFASKHARLPWLAALLMASTAALAQSADKDQEQIKRLRQQIRQLQQQHDTALQEAQAAALRQQTSAEQAVKASKAESSGQQAALGAAQRRSASLETELKAAQQRNDGLKTEVLQLQRQLDETRLTMTSSQATHEQSLSSWRARHEALNQQHAQCRGHNAELYTLGGELLERYETKGVAEVLASREPFVQTARVRLENLKADYQDKLDAARLKPMVLAPQP